VTRDNAARSDTEDRHAASELAEQAREPVKQMLDVWESQMLIPAGRVEDRVVRTLTGPVFQISPRPACSHADVWREISPAT
jgi:hypothetical protein